MVHIRIGWKTLCNKDQPKAQDPTTVVMDNKKDPSFEGENYAQIGGIWTLIHEIGSPKFYELLIKK